MIFCYHIYSYGEGETQCSVFGGTDNTGNTERCDSGTQEQLYKWKSVENAKTSSLTTSACLRLRSRHRFRKVSVFKDGAY